jgi:tRNA nucleotidyltransferase (CCA-adding enzyme)
MMSSRPIVLSQETVTDSAVRLWCLMRRRCRNLMTLCEADITTKTQTNSKNIAILKSFQKIVGGRT